MRITLYDVELDVGYTFSHGYPATREEPGEPDTLEIDSVMAGGEDISPIIEAAKLWPLVYDAVLTAIKADELQAMEP